MRKITKNIPTWCLWGVPLFVLFIYAHWIEPIWIEVTRYTTKADIKASLTIAHLSDLHIRSLGVREARILDVLKRERPDVVLITGDSVAENGNYQAVRDFLAQVHAPLGVWSVNGNWEHWRPSAEGKNFYESAGVRLLDNSASQLTSEIWLIGIDDELAGVPDLRAAESVPNAAFKIGLFHSPSFFEEAFNNFNLVLAGHTHGGQVRLPFLPPIWLPEGSGNFVSGWYKKGEVSMYVSRGLGNSIFDIRFLCRPELSIIRLNPKIPGDGSLPSE